MSERILLVDDDLAVLGALKAMLRQDGYLIESAEDGITALEIFSRFRPAVVLSDLRMPVMDGFEFLCRCREIDPDSVRIILTGYSGIRDVERAVAEGHVWRYLTKPWNDNRLRTVVREGVVRCRVIVDRRLSVERLFSVGALVESMAEKIDAPLMRVLDRVSHLRNENRVQDAEVAEDLNQIEEAVRRCRRILGDIQGYSGEEQDAEAELDEVLASSIRLARYGGGKGVTVEFESANVRVAGGRDRLVQVFVNLITNAIHAIVGGRHGGRVHIASAREGASVVVSVVDDGPGIAAAHLERIFEPFFTTKPPGVGTGLGLPICRRIIEDFGGRITVRSQPGSGSEFRVQLPLAGPDRIADGTDSVRADGVREKEPQ